MSNDAKCTITANPDISGLGVRISIYGQAALTLLVLGIVFADGKITKKERDVLIEAHRNLLVTACALLAASYIQIIIGQLSPYHALLVLNLSWINTAMGFAFTYFEDEIAPPMEALGMLAPHHPTGYILTGLEAIVNQQRGPQRFQWDTFSSYSGGNISALLHLGLMSVLGIHTWLVIPHQTPIWEDECRSLVTIVLGGHSHSLLSPQLRKGSLAMYSLGVVLGLAGLIAMLVFKLVLNFLRRSASPEMRNIAATMQSVLQLVPLPGMNSGGIGVALLPCLILVAVGYITFFIVNTELTIARNSQFLSTQEREWSFGQTLAIILLITPVWTAFRGAYVWWKETRSKPDEQKLGLENEVKRDEKHDDTLVDAGYYISHV